MTSPRIFDAEPSTFDPSTQHAAEGEIVARQTPGSSRVGLVRRNAAGAKLVDLVVGEVVVTMSTTVTGALGLRVAVQVDDRGNSPIVGAIVQFQVNAGPGATIATHVPGPNGKTLAILHNAASPEYLIATMETGVLGKADLDLTTGAAANGEAYGVALFPGPGVDAVLLAFAP